MQVVDTKEQSQGFRLNTKEKAPVHSTTFGLLQQIVQLMYHLSHI